MLILLLLKMLVQELDVTKTLLIVLQQSCRIFVAKSIEIIL